MAKRILYWIPLFPDRGPVRLTLVDEVASAFVRAGVAAPADPGDAAVLGAGGPLDPGNLTEMVLEHGSSRRLTRLLMPAAVAAIAVAAGVAASVGTPIAGGPAVLAIAGTPPAATVGDSGVFAPAISGGQTPYTLSLLSGSLPPGRSLSALTVVGTYTAAGAYAYTLRVTDALGATADLPVNVTVAAAAPGILTAPSFTGTAQQGQTLTGTRGTYTNSPSSYTNQWQSSTDSGATWTNIAGATSLNYLQAAADVGKVLRLVEVASNAGGSSAANPSSASGVIAAAAAVGGLNATSFPLAPSIHYHPNSQAGSVTKSGGKITACPDIRGLAALSGLEYGTGTPIGPVEMTDALGRKFWRFTGENALFVANTLNTMQMRGYAAFAVVRIHRHATEVQIFNPRYTAYTDDTTNTSAGTAQKMFRTAPSSQGMASVQALAVLDTATGYRAVPGCQISVTGILSRTAGNGGQRAYGNKLATANVTQNSNATTAMTGGVIGAFPVSGNLVSAPNNIVGNWLDLYEFAYWNNIFMTDAQGDAAAAAMTDNWAIPALTRQLVLEGDSITFGAVPTNLTPVTTSADNLGMWLTEPGAGLIPDDVRVVNQGVFGNVVGNLQSRKNATTSTFSLTSTNKFPGGPANNVVAVQLGRNDMGAGSNISAASHYANVVTLLNSATGGSEGYLQRGFRVVQVANIATTNAQGYQDRIETFRGMIADTVAHTTQAQFLADTLSGPGQTFDGQLSVLHLYDVTVGGVTQFKTQAEANAYASRPYYDSDATHLRALGSKLMATGGDTAQYGYGSIL